MRGTVVVLGFLAEAAAWAAVSWGGRSVWRFVAVATRWERFRRATGESYSLEAGAPFRVVLVVALLVSVPGQELFWRGLVAPVLGRTFLGVAAGAVAGWAAYVLANAPSRSLAILADAVVGGAVWARLGWWSGGVLAPLASHILWTGPMLAFPPGAGRKAATE